MRSSLDTPKVPPNSGIVVSPKETTGLFQSRYELALVIITAVTFLTGVISPPSLMDDVDASQGLIARNMLLSGDWVTARLDGVVFFDKAPLKYWITTIFYSVFGAHDWVARLPALVSYVSKYGAKIRYGNGRPG